MTKRNLSKVLAGAGNRGHYGYAADAIERYVLGNDTFPPEPPG